MRIIILTILALSLAACSPYQPDVTQGNMYTPSMVSKLKTGMSAQEVVKIMGGEPVYQNAYNSNTMYYVYTSWNYKTGAKKPKKLILTFSNSTLTKIQNS